jgi:hypothetical protein
MPVTTRPYPIQSNAQVAATESRYQSMTSRTSSKTVTFSHPFMLSGIDGIQPAGTYTVETEEELIQELSFPAYRRTATLIFLPQPDRGVLAQIATIDPLELEVALERDAMKGMA